jgi:hypothetical protein
MPGSRTCHRIAREDVISLTSPGELAGYDEHGESPSQASGRQDQT